MGIMPAKKSPKPRPPFVVIMRHDHDADPTLGIATKWNDALAMAGAFWESYDGEFRPKSPLPFKVGEGYEVSDLDYTIKPGISLTLTYAGGEGPCIDIARVRARDYRP